MLLTEHALILYSFHPVRLNPRPGETVSILVLRFGFFLNLFFNDIDSNYMEKTFTKKPLLHLTNCLHHYKALME